MYRLARQWNLSTEVSLAAALLFGVHPVHSESVAWVAALPDPLAAIFILSSLLLYERYYHGRLRKPVVLGASIALALAAMLSKEVAAVFPVFLVAREMLERPEGETLSGAITRAGRRAAPFFAMIVLYLGMRYYVLGFLRRDEPNSLGIPALQVLATIPSILLSYARMLFVPFPLAVMYGNTYVLSMSAVQFFVALIAVAAIIAGAIWQESRGDCGGHSACADVLSEFLVAKRTGDDEQRDESDSGVAVPAQLPGGILFRPT